MYIGQELLLKHQGALQKGRIKEIYPEELEIILDTGELVKKKYWEVRKITNKNEENEK